MFPILQQENRKEMIIKFNLHLQNLSINMKRYLNVIPYQHFIIAWKWDMQTKGNFICHSFTFDLRDEKQYKSVDNKRRKTSFFINQIACGDVSLQWIIVFSEQFWCSIKQYTNRRWKREKWQWKKKIRCRFLLVCYTDFGRFHLQRNGLFPWPAVKYENVQFE